MKTGSVDRQSQLKTALVRAGFTVEGVKRQGNKTVVTVSRRAERGETGNRDRAAAGTRETAT